MTQPSDASRETVLALLDRIENAGRALGAADRLAGREDVRQTEQQRTVQSKLTIAQLAFQEAVDALRAQVEALVAVLEDCVQELLLGSRAHAVHPFALYDANCGACRKTRLVKRAQTALAAERASGEGQP